MRKISVYYKIFILLFLCSFFIGCQTFAYNGLKPTGKFETFVINNDTVILISENPNAKDNFAAETLQKYLMEIYGKRIPIKTSPITNYISLGQTNEFNKADFQSDIDNLNPEGYAIRQKDGNIYIFGGEDRGPVYGVLSLLEEDLEVRWYAKGESASIPKSDKKEILYIPRLENPAFTVRFPGSDEAFNADFALYNRLQTFSHMNPLGWYEIDIHKELGGKFDNHGMCHSSFDFVSPSIYGEEHPEYFNANKTQLCWSNPNVIKICTEKVKQLASEGKTLIALSPQDGYHLCDCEKCNVLDSVEGTKAATLYKALNEIIEEVNKEYPDVKLLTLAYLDYIKPSKTIKPNKNFLIFVCSDNPDWPFPLLNLNETEKFRSNLDNWVKAGGNCVVWSYNVNFDHFLLPTPNMIPVSDNLKIMKDLGAMGVFMQADSYPSSLENLGYMRAWVWSKLLWNPNRDVNALMKDFVFGYYGNSANAVWKYVDMVNNLYRDNIKIPHKVDSITPNTQNPLMVDGIRWKPTEPIYTDRFINNAVRYFAEAEKKADDDIILDRVKTLKCELLYLILTRELGFYYSGSMFAKPEGNGLTKAKKKKRTKEEYLDMINELDTYLNKNNVKVIVEDFTIDNKNKIIDEFKRAANNDTSDLEIVSLKKNDWYIQKGEDDNSQNIKDFSNWQSIKINKNWENTIGGYDGYAWYKTNIKTDNKAKYKYLVFMAVDEDATVYINGDLAIEHTCDKLGITPEDIWKNPFSIDIKPYLKKGENQISVKVYDRFMAGGIYENVYLVSTDKEQTDELFNKLKY